VVRIREAQGPFVVTIFTPAETFAGIPAEVAVMVQQRETGQVLTDAEVDLSFAPPAGAAVQPGEILCAPSNAAGLPAPATQALAITTLPATHAQAVNKLLAGTSVRLRAVGDWQVRAAVRCGGEEASVTCVLPVRLASSRLAWLWPYLALPPLAMALFAINQWIRDRTGKERRLSRGAFPELEPLTPSFAKPMEGRPTLSPSAGERENDPLLAAMGSTRDWKPADQA